MSGKTGKQLELVVERLLNCSFPRAVIRRNVIIRNFEVDLLVNCDREVEDLRQSKFIICECKNWSKPVKMKDWTKFYEKMRMLRELFIRVFSDHLEIEGWLISTGGFEEEVRQCAKNATEFKVKLIDGEQLNDMLQAYGFAPSQLIKD
jgi:restriction endonuclease Mrr